MPQGKFYTTRPFGAEYFQSYCSDGNYDDVFYRYSEVRSCMRMVGRAKHKIRSVAVLGAATGRVLEEFHRRLGIIPYGCELSRWAYLRIPSLYRERIKCQDMRQYLPWMASKGYTVDLVFSNSLFYLPKKDIPNVLRRISGIARFVHFYPEPEGDPWVCIDEPYDWWAERFNKVGFYRTRSAYLWKFRST